MSINHDPYGTDTSMMLLYENFYAKVVLQRFIISKMPPDVLENLLLWVNHMPLDIKHIYEHIHDDIHCESIQIICNPPSRITFTKMPPVQMSSSF